MKTAHTGKDARASSFHNVVVATDFSPGASLALARAGRLPVAAGGAITVLHVMADAADAPGQVAVRRALEQAAAAVRAAQHDAGMTRRTVRTHIARGKPFVEVIRFARETKAELIVLGRHGARAFTELLLGSTAERVVRGDATAVLVVNSDASGPYRRPLVAVDGSPCSRRAFGLARRVIDPSVSTVEIIHAYEAPYETMLVMRGGLTQEQLRPHRLHAKEAARAMIDEFVAALGDAGHVVRIGLRRGEPRSVILSIARQRRADLLALGTQGRSGLARMFLGSVAEGLIHAATCDVLVARPPAR